MFVQRDGGIVEWSDWQVPHFSDQSSPPASRELRQWGLRAEYWIKGDGEPFDEEDATESGSFLRLRTDQVRFYPIDALENEYYPFDDSGYRQYPRAGEDPVEPLPLTEIPPLVLSEVLRDVDLFVGVASVGNDPAWQDGGPGGRFREYWTSYGFGELNQSAEIRRALLERLIPRLAIADRCHLEGRFLYVKGERHTYKIHLGSGNILMSPNDQYLCIVSKSGDAGAETGYLPFEGDRILAVVLSKAMLLADDTKITDPTILSQLWPRYDGLRTLVRAQGQHVPWADGKYEGLSVAEGHAVRGSASCRSYGQGRVVADQELARLGRDHLQPPRRRQVPHLVEGVLDAGAEELAALVIVGDRGPFHETISEGAQGSRAGQMQARLALAQHGHVKQVRRRTECRRARGRTPQEGVSPPRPTVLRRKGSRRRRSSRPSRIGWWASACAGRTGATARRRPSVRALGTA
ncbi:hypothetical protein [Streptomyces sp. NEAU-YJ-81]|uniref:DUF7737 domain-containing protein n=1 Tax=Streptomyces sp. NEAU-YJ-81 TaxID=2820288 RepID=UPI0027DF3B62|nr:hypothetical protein [Streptomyces sp. NEAU-YJ-81]